MLPVDEAALEIRSLVKTNTPQVHFHCHPIRDERHFRRLFAVIRAYLDDMHSARFVFRPIWGCASCEFCQSACRSWLNDQAGGVSTGFAPAFRFFDRRDAG